MTGPGPGRLLAESVAALNAHPWRTLAVALTALAMCVAVFCTTGRASATEQRVLAAVDQAGARLISMSWRDPEGGLDPSAVGRIASLDQVEWAFGLTAVFDVRNLHLPGGASCPAKMLVGKLPDSQVRLHSGSYPGPGEALVTSTSANCLGLNAPSGTVTRARSQRATPVDAFAVVGQVELGDSLEGLDSFAILEAPDGASPVPITITALARTTDQVSVVASAMLQLAGTPDRMSLALETSAALADLNACSRANSQRVRGPSAWQ